MGLFYTSTVLVNTSKSKILQLFPCVLKYTYYICNVNSDKPNKKTVL